MQSFSELPLSPELLRAVKEMGYETPSPIQAEALPVLLADDTDFLGLAGTGTGKTATFSIPLLEKLDPSIKAVQALILCPTRELAVQVAGQIDLLGKYKGLRSLTIYGGAGYNDQLRGLSRGAQIVVGTPGRVIDHLERGSLKLDQVKVLILDEADEMFSMGFKEELDAVIEAMPEEGANTWLFSATMSPEVRRVVDRNLHDPKTVQVNRKEMLSSGVEQYFYKCQESEKPHIISSLIEAAEDFYGVIFCQTKALVQDLTVFLMDRGYKVDSLHGDKDQNSREKTMQAFRDRKLQILVCTDVAARGLDVKDITHVINYSLPRELDSYVHRIGRTARSGKTGYAMNLVTFSHRHLLTRIEAFTKVRMTEGFVPTAREIGAKKVAKLLPRLVEQQHGDRVLEVMGEEFKTQLASMTVEDVASKFIAMMMSDVFGQPARREKGAARQGARAEERGERYERRAAAPRSEQRSFEPRGERSFEPRGERYERPAPGSTRPGGELNPERGGIPRSQMQFRKSQDSNVVDPMDLDVASILDEAPVFGVQSPVSGTESRPVRAPRAASSERFDRAPRGERFERAPRFERASRAGGAESSRPEGFERSERPARAAKPARVEGGLKSRHAAPGKTNWGKAPRHDAGAGRPSRHVEETPVMNRRARRAAKFAGQPTF